MPKISNNKIKTDTILNWINSFINKINHDN